MALKKASVQKVELDDFPEVPDSIPRDRWDRPLIAPADGGKPRAYTRASTLGKAIEDTYHLSKWQQRSIAFGLSRRPDLVALVASIATNEGDDRSALDELCEKAHEAAKGDKGANVGTALHKLSERRDAGEDLSYLPEKLLEAIDAYSEQMQLFDVLATETFVVCDPLETAGTFDRVVRLRVDLEFYHAERKRVVLPAGTVMVLDLKTGSASSAKYWGAGYGVQQTVYACGEPYELGAGRRTWTELLGEGNRPSTDWALILHVPSDSPKDSGLVVVDLDLGAKMGDLCLEIREARKAKALLSECYPAPVPDDLPAEPESDHATYSKEETAAYLAEMQNGARANRLIEAIRQAASDEALSALWDQNKGVWTGDHTEAVKARAEELKAKASRPAHAVALDLIGQLRNAPDGDALNALWEQHQAIWTDDATRMVHARLRELAG